MAARSEMHKIESIQNLIVNLMQLSNNTRIQLNLNVTKIKFKNSNEFVSPNDLVVGEYVLIIKQGSTITKAELQKEKKDASQNDFYTILELVRFNLIQDSPLKSTLVNSYTRIRKIPPGHKNFTVAFMMGLIDYCFTYNKAQIINSAKSLLYEYDNMRIDNPRSDVLEIISQLFDQNEETYAKLEKLTDIYKRKTFELDSIFRSLIYITVKLDFHRLGTSEYKQERQEVSHYDIFLNQYLNPSDTLFLLERINIKLKVFDLTRSYLTSYASSSSSRFTLLYLPNGDYLNVFSQQESELRLASNQERLISLTFLNNLNSAKESNRAAKKEAEILEIKEKQKQSDEIMRVIQLINIHIGNQLNSNSVIDIIKEPDLVETFKQYCCNSCLKFTITYEFPCSHKMCYDCYASNYDQNIQKCGICFCCEYPRKIYEFFNNVHSP